MQKQNAIYRYISTTTKIQQNVLLKVVSTDRKIFFVHVTQDNYNVFTPCSYCVARVCKWPLAVII